LNPRPQPTASSPVSYKGTLVKIPPAPLEENLRDKTICSMID
jgi:hypothetical protein